MKIFNMDCKVLLISASLLSFSFLAGAQQKQPEKTMEDYASEIADKMTTQFDLEVWQTFYVDSTIAYCYGQLQKELESMQRAKVENSELYQAVSDEWMERIDSTFHTFFTEKQWADYCKSISREQRARKKRMSQRAEGK